MTTRAALTRPKSAGASSRVSTTSTSTRSTATAPLPQATQAMLPMACRVRPCSPDAPSAGWRDIQRATDSRVGTVRSSGS